MLERLKVAWIRDPNAPPGQPAPGRLNCPCGGAPVTEYKAEQGDIHCRCGQLYTWNGWLKKPEVPAHPITK